ncbi:MAG: hypothetical protein K6U08_04515 [Firmicutes bacterium]|nr:hypothetical protein [Bacillota bacterium]
MSGPGFSLAAFIHSAATGAAVYLTGLALRFLDDLVDEPPPPDRTGAACGVCAAVALVLAAGISPATAVSLFLAAYAVGMAASPRERMPSGLPAWAESLVALVLAGLLAGAAQTVSALLIALAVQAVDDRVDLADDTREGRPNLAAAAGPRVAVALAAVLALAALVLAPQLTVAAAVTAAPFVTGGVKDGPHPRTGRPHRYAAWGAVTVLVAGLAGVAGAAGTRAAQPPPAAWFSAGVPVSSGLLLAVLGAGLGVVAAFEAYRRGLAQGEWKGRRAGRALVALEERLRRLQDSEGPRA